MKNYEVIITRNFFDSVENVDRVLGTKTEEFMCTKERYEYLKSCNNAVKLLEIAKEENNEEKQEIEEKPRKKSHRK